MRRVKTYFCLQSIAVKFDWQDPIIGVRFFSPALLHYEAQINVTMIGTSLAIIVVGTNEVML